MILTGHARRWTSENGRFVVWKHLHFGTRGAASSEYIVEDTNHGSFKSFSDLSNVKCFVLHKLYGLETAPLFPNQPHFGFYAKGLLKKHSEWHSIQYG